MVIGLSAQDSQPSTKRSDEDDKKKWDVGAEHVEHRSLQFQVDEGTWMNLDVSPDGQEIVFDLLGDLYFLPIAGGKAKPLRQGLAFDIQPRFSPDGAWISFTSDAGLRRRACTYA